MASDTSSAPRLSLRLKILAVICFVCLMAILGTGLTSYWVGANAITEAAKNQVRSVAATVQQSLDLHLGRLRDDVTSVAGDPNLRDGLLDLGTAKRTALQELAEHPAAEAARAAGLAEATRTLLVPLSSIGVAASAEASLDPTALLAHSAFVDPAPAILPAAFRMAASATEYADLLPRFDGYFASAGAGRADLEDVLLIDADGAVVYSLRKRFDFGADLVQGPDRLSPLGAVYRAALERFNAPTLAERVVLSDAAPYLKAWNRPLLFVASAVGALGDDTPDGVVVVAVNLSELTSIARLRGEHARAGLGRQGTSYLIGPDGRARSDVPGLASETLAYLTNGGIDRATTAATVAKIDTLAVRTLLGASATDRVGSAIYPSLGGAEVVGAYRPLETGGVPLGLVVEMHTAEALREVGTLAQSILLVGTGMLLVAVIASSFLAGLVTRPVAELSRAARALAAGDDTARAAVLSTDEIGETARQFNAMAEARVAAQRRTEADKQALEDGITALLEVTSEASAGNLAVRPPELEGALGKVSEALGDMLEKVGALLRDSQAAADRVAGLALEVRAAAEQTAQGAQRQAEELVGTSAAVQEMASQVESVSSNAASAAMAADRAKMAATTGATTVQDIIERMERIRNNVRNGTRRLRKLGERTEEISGVVQIISQISLQTNMLALNAAIEASRAGEHGKGFGIVAEEVRRLAERTVEAAGEIEEIAHGIQAETADTVAAIEKQTGEVEAESRQVAEAGVALADIGEVSNRSSDLIREIEIATKQQVIAARQIVEAIAVVAQVARDAESGAKVSRTTADNLVVLSAQLDQKVRRFRTA